MVRNKGKFTVVSRVEREGHAYLGQSSRGSTVYAGMDATTGQLVAVIEWTLKWRRACRKLDVDEQEKEKEDAAKYMKRVRYSHFCYTQSTVAPFSLSKLRGAETCEHIGMMELVLNSYQQILCQVSVNECFIQIGIQLIENRGCLYPPPNKGHYKQ